MPVPSGLNEDTDDASIEPLRGRISSFLQAPLPGKSKQIQKGSTKQKAVQIQKSKAIQIMLSNLINTTRL